MVKYDYRLLICILQDWSEYGIDCEENVMLNTDEETSAVVIPEVRNPLSESDFEELQALSISSIYINRPAYLPLSELMRVNVIPHQMNIFV